MLKPYACLALFCSLLLPSFAHADDSDVGCVTTEWKLLGANHKVCVSAFNDPDIPGVACYISQAKPAVFPARSGFAEDPSNFAISCSQVGPIEIPAKLPNRPTYSVNRPRSFSRPPAVTRIWDAKRNTLVYLAVSRRLVDGSPFNAISTVPVKQ